MPDMSTHVKVIHVRSRLFGEILGNEEVSGLRILDPVDVGEQNRCARSAPGESSDWRRGARVFSDWLSGHRGVSAGEVPHLSVQGSEHSLKTKITHWTSLHSL